MTIAIDETHGFCRKCRYPLYGLRASRCPECGRWFDRKNPATFLVSPIAPAVELLGKALALAALPAVVLTDLASRRLLRLHLDGPGWCGNCTQGVLESCQHLVVAGWVLTLNALLGAFLVRRTPWAVICRYPAWAAVLWCAGWKIALWYATRYL